MNAPRFLSDLYLAGRIPYPPSFFSYWQHLLAKQGIELVLDLGCGTGLSSDALFKAGFNGEILGIDFDESMLKVARAELVKHSFSTQQIDLLKMDTQLPTSSAMMIGSALHWFASKKFGDAVLKAINPNGWILIFENQSPVCTSQHESAKALNSWVKSQYNSQWKAPKQSPRGTLKEIIKNTFDGFEINPYEQNFKMKELLSVNDYTALLFSQSRYLHYEKKISEENQDVAEYRNWVLAQIKTFYGIETVLEFDFHLKGFLLKRVLK